jgi:hypothetical protein
MEAYKFETRISKSGQIKIPVNNKLFGKLVEIIIVPKNKPNKTKMSVSDFLDKWAGFLSDSNSDKSKYDYLNENY